MNLYDQTCLECSRLITNKYSTSFSLGIKAFDRKFQLPIYAIYGFVRYADEIVDTFEQGDKEILLASFRADTFKAIEDKISLNPVLQSFQLIVNQYGIDKDLIEAFLESMKMDLYKLDYVEETYQKYIYGSAEVVGLMCLRIFCTNDTERYNQLTPTARKLGSAFQKINFLRDIKSDFADRGRTYFPGLNVLSFNDVVKKEIETDIKADFDSSLIGIRKLPDGCRLGVYVAYRYYLRLFEQIQKTPAAEIMEKRIRVADSTKLLLFAQAIVKNKLNTLT